MRNETELHFLLSETPPLCEVFEIPLAVNFFDENVSGQLLACFEVREVQRKYDAMLQVRFIPIIWQVTSQETDLKLERKFNRHRQGWFCSFELGVDKFAHNKSVKFGPTGNILLDPVELRGIGIATFAWKRLIEWAQIHYPEYQVGDVSVSFHDANDPGDPTNHGRRNHFYEKHGFVGTFSDAKEKTVNIVVPGASWL